VTASTIEMIRSHFHEKSSLSVDVTGEISLKWASDRSGVKSRDEHEQDRKVSVDSGRLLARTEESNIPEIETGTTDGGGAVTAVDLWGFSGQPRDKFFTSFLIRQQMSLFVWRICHQSLDIGHFLVCLKIATVLRDEPHTFKVKLGTSFKSEL